MSNIEKALIFQAEKLQKGQQRKKAIVVLLNGIKKHQSTQFSEKIYTYLALLYLDEKNFLQSARFFARALECYEGPTPPKDLFLLLEGNATKAKEDSLYLMYRLAMCEEVNNQLRGRLKQLITRGVFTGTKTALTHHDLISLHKKILDGIPVIQWEKLPANKNNDVMILCSQFLGKEHAPTHMAMGVAKHVKEMGYNPILICLNSWDIDKKYSGGSYIANKYSHYSSHRDFDLDLNQHTIPEYPFSTVKYQGEQYPFFFIDMPFDQKLIQLPYLFSDAINNENVMISIGTNDICFDILGRYTKIYAYPTSSSIPITLTTYPSMYRTLSEQEIEITSNKEYYPYGIVHAGSPYEIKIKYEDIDRSNLPENIEYIIVGYRLEQEINEAFIKRLAMILHAYPSSIFRFVGEINNKISFFERMLAHKIPDSSIILAGQSNNMRASLSNANFYLNPKRIGGGASGFEALALNIPVISYPYGDVYQACGPRSGFEDDHAVMTFINRYMNDMSFRKEISLYCKAQFLSRENPKKTITDVTRGALQ